MRRFQVTEEFIGQLAQLINLQTLDLREYAANRKAESEFSDKEQPMEACQSSRYGGHSSK